MAVGGQGNANIEPVGCKMQAQAEATMDRFLKIDEVAQYLGLGRSKVYQLIASGDIKSARFDRSRRVPLSAVVEFTKRAMVGAN
jgi:excisionase family DNA binding protein